MMQPTIRAKQSKLRGYRAASRDRQGFEGLNLLGFQLLQNRFLGVVLVDRPACVVKADLLDSQLNLTVFFLARRKLWEAQRNDAVTIQARRAESEFCIDPVQEKARAIRHI